MSQIIISDLETNQELDRQALNGVMGGKRNGGYRNRGYRRIKFIYEEKFQESYKFKHYNPCYHYTPCHFDHYHCHW